MPQSCSGPTPTATTDEVPVGTSAVKSWQHPPETPVPEGFRYGPVKGTKIDLAGAVRPQGGKRDTRRLDRLIEREQIWIRGIGHDNEAWFVSERV